MRKILLIAFLFLFISCVYSAQSNDFVNITDSGESFFTHKDLVNSDFIVGSDKVFYGSKNGEVTIRVYLRVKIGLVDKAYKIGVESKGKNFKVKKVVFPDAEIENQNPKDTTNWVSTRSINVKNLMQFVDITVLFDPSEIGLGEKIDIVIYDLQLNELFRYDPFVSGYGNRTQIILDTNGISLGGDVTNDHTILIPIRSDHPFWSSDTCADGTGVTFTQSDELTELDFNTTFAGWDFVGNDANVWVEYTETFDATTDSEGWFYWNGTCTDNSDGAGAYITNLVSGFHQDEVRGSTSYDSKGTNNGTITGAGVNQSGQVERSYNFDDVDDWVIFDNEANFDFLSANAGDWTVKWWQKVPVGGYIFHKGVFLDSQGISILSIDADGKTRLELKTDATHQDVYASGINTSGGAWHQVAITSSSGTIKMYTDTTEETPSPSGTGSFTGQNNAIQLRMGSTESGAGDLEMDTDEVSIFNYGLSADEIKLLYNSEAESLVTFGAEEVPQNDFNVTFNIFQATGTNFDLNNLTIDFNVNVYDQIDVNSPITISDVNKGDYLITVSKTNWDSNTFVLSVDANKTQTIYIDRFIYPTVAQFEVRGDTNTTKSLYQNVASFSYETTYGSSTQTDVSCSFWVTSNNATSSTASWRLESSIDGSTWTTRDETTRTISPMTRGGSIYIATPDYNIVDGNQFFRLQHKRGVGASYDLSTHDVICHSFIARDQNSFFIQDEHDNVTGLSTTSATFEVLRSGNFTSGALNGFMYYYGDMIYSQAGVKGNASIKSDLFNVPDSNSASYPRTTGAGATGVGGFSGMFEDLNQTTAYAVQTYGKTSAGTSSFDYTLHLKYLNQMAGEFDVNKNFVGKTLTSNSLIKIATLNLTLAKRGDYRAMTILPFSCSSANCDLNTVLQIVGNGYDVNSFSHKRTSNAIADENGVLVNQYLFSDVNTGSIEVNLWASTSTGTITLTGGSFSVINTNEQTTVLRFPPNPPDIYNPINGADVNGVVDFNCFATDPDNDTLTYDVNLLIRDTNATILVLQTGGIGSGDFNSLTVANGIYTFSCLVSDGNLTASFDNKDYNFSITNPVPPSQPLGEGYNRFYAPYDDRLDLNITNSEFINDKLVAEESTTIKDAQEQKMLLIGIIILLAVLIILALGVYLKGRK